MTQLIAVDWGTTSLRAALLDDRGQVIDHHHAPEGILAVPAGQFASFLIAACGHWMPAGGTFCLLSGMVGSRQGWEEAPYCPCPAGFADIAARLHWIDAGRALPRVAIVPGLADTRQAVPDVMRGEETQVFGALNLLGIDGGLFVLPGTHSKWVRVRDRRIEQFATYMTGEFYALLRRHSILARTLPPDDGPLDEGAFLQGIDCARRSSNLLHAAFSARTLSLFDRLPPAALPSYLSGLVIGEELRSQDFGEGGGPVVAIGAEALTARYALALGAFGVDCRQVGDEATWRGLWSIARTLERLA